MLQFCFLLSSQSRPSDMFLSEQVPTGPFQFTAPLAFPCFLSKIAPQVLCPFFLLFLNVIFLLSTCHYQALSIICLSFCPLEWSIYVDAGFWSGHCNISSTYKYIYLYSIIYVHIRLYIMFVYVVGTQYIVTNCMNYSLFCLSTLQVN